MQTPCRAQLRGSRLVEISSLSAWHRRSTHLSKYGVRSRARANRRAECSSLPRAQLLSFSPLSLFRLPSVKGSLTFACGQLSKRLLRSEFIVCRPISVTPEHAGSPANRDHSASGVTDPWCLTCSESRYFEPGKVELRRLTLRCWYIILVASWFDFGRNFGIGSSYVWRRDVALLHFCWKTKTFRRWFHRRLRQRLLVFSLWTVWKWFSCVALGFWCGWCLTGHIYCGRWYFSFSDIFLYTSHFPICI